jgi:catechol 2,3-dioxygenase-like lactoylglutathione lyase family enzyme
VLRERRTDDGDHDDNHGGSVQLTSVVTQLRTTDLEASIAFYTTVLGFTVEFRYSDFYAGLRGAGHVVHLKLSDAPDPSIAFVESEGHFHLYFNTPDVEAVAASLKRHGVTLMHDVHQTEWQTRECIARDNEGHVLYFGQPL